MLRVEYVVSLRRRLKLQLPDQVVTVDVNGLLEALCEAAERHGVASRAKSSEAEIQGLVTGGTVDLSGDRLCRSEPSARR